MGTESDVGAIENAFVDTHKFDLDLNLRGKINANEVKSGIANLVDNLVRASPKFITIFIMSHGKKNNW